MKRFSLKGRRSISKARLLSILLCLFGASSLRAQEVPPFSADRPGLADLPYTVPVRYFQVETGCEYFKREMAKIVFLPTALLRTGLASGVELRLGGKLLRIDSLSIENDRSIRLDQLSLGLKTMLIQEDGLLPGVALLTDIGVSDLRNITFRKFRPGCNAILLMENHLGPAVSVNYNIGLQWGEFPDGLTKMYAVCVELTLPDDRTSVFAEQSSCYNTGDKNDYWFDGGITHLLSPIVQIDLSAGVNFNRGGNDFFISGGYSIRLEGRQRQVRLKKF